MISMSELFLLMHERGASDLHLTVAPRRFCASTACSSPLPSRKLTPESSQALIFSLLTDDQRQKFEATNELDLAFGLKGIGRLRMNIYRQRGAIGAAVRAIPSTFKSFEEIGLPNVVYEILKFPRDWSCSWVQRAAENRRLWPA